MTQAANFDLTMRFELTDYEWTRERMATASGNVGSPAASAGNRPYPSAL